MMKKSLCYICIFVHSFTWYEVRQEASRECGPVQKCCLFLHKAKATRVCVCVFGNFELIILRV